MARSGCRSIKEDRMKKYESTEVLRKKLRNSIIELIIRLVCTFVYGALMGAGIMLGSWLMLRAL